ncbi:cytochrome P450 [Streptomyces armeniacus]|uniref:Cytochrome P450 n=1 Tax=Streptomyces armeniacus TaxID=83291 RepID=A0A345XRC9_9ACTN|nr:cytochrome P450 [Streptomyces armeniacus]AXK34195.1 cytochrome P450 [Streptomyces armeniacus]
MSAHTASTGSTGSTASTGSTTAPAVPDFPLERSGRCPFDPPGEHRDWQRAPGLQQVRLWDGTRIWAVTRHEEVRAGLRDPRISADGLHPGLPSLAASRKMAPEEVVFPRMDDPQHAEQRRMLTGAFTVRQTEAMRPRIQEVVDDALEGMIAGGRPADLVTKFALPVPSRIIAVLLGVPYEDHDLFEDSSKLLLDLSADVERVQAAKQWLYTYLLDLVRRREREPGDDLLSRLVAERVTSGELTRRQAVYIARALLVAGHETTANMITLSTLTLLRHPEELARVRDTDDPRTVADAVEELLRYQTIAENAVVRVALEDITIGGQPVRAGEGLIFCLPVANRDGGLLDDPDSFSIDHQARGHVAFGYGIHQCLGQNLARAELQIALPTLLRRLPGLRLAVPFEEIEFHGKRVTFGAARLPVTW